MKVILAFARATLTLGNMSSSSTLSDKTIEEMTKAYEEMERIPMPLSPLHISLGTLRTFVSTTQTPSDRILEFIEATKDIPKQAIVLLDDGKASLLTDGGSLLQFA